MGYFSVPFERFTRDETSEWAGAFTLLGMHFLLSSYLVAILII